MVLCPLLIGTQDGPVKPNFGGAAKGGRASDLEHGRSLSEHGPLLEASAVAGTGGEGAAASAGGLSGGGGDDGSRSGGKGQGSWSQAADQADSSLETHPPAPGRSGAFAAGGAAAAGAAGALAASSASHGSMQNSEPTATSESAANDAENDTADTSTGSAFPQPRQSTMGTNESEMSVDSRSEPALMPMAREQDQEEVEEGLPPVQELPRGEFPSLVVIPPVVDLPRLKSLSTSKTPEDSEELPPAPPSRRVRPEPSNTPPAVMYGAAGRALRAGDLESEGDTATLADTDEDSVTEGGRSGAAGPAPSEPSEASEDVGQGIGSGVERWFTLGELAQATNNFGEQGQRNILGSGRNGTVYKARTSDGGTLAVKRLSFHKYVKWHWETFSDI